MSKTNLIKNEFLSTGQHSSKNSKEYIPVNKGHFELDTEERVQAFHDKLGRGWETEYREYRSCWVTLPREKRVRDYPILLDVELSSACNLSCPMCYTTTEHFKKNVTRKFMEWELFQKIVDEVAGKVYSLRLSWRGESTLHDQFVDAVRYAKNSGIKEVSFLTNGSKLTLEYFIELTKAGADWISVSFDGLGEEYEKIRKPLKYRETYAKLRDAMEYKNSENLEKPVIKVQTIWPAIRKNPEVYYNTIRDVSDLVAFNPIIDYLEKDTEIVYEENFSCPQLYERLFVSSTGDVMMCNSDEYGEEIVGNAWEKKIHDIWHGARLKRIRELHGRHDGFRELATCRRCFFPRKTEVNEMAIVNGRTIMVENYVNRCQVIGE